MSRNVTANIELGVNIVIAVAIVVVAAVVVKRYAFYQQVLEACRESPRGND